MTKDIDLIDEIPIKKHPSMIKPGLLGIILVVITLQANTYLKASYESFKARIVHEALLEAESHEWAVSIDKKLPLNKASSDGITKMLLYQSQEYETCKALLQDVRNIVADNMH